MANQAFPFQDAGQDARINLPEGENSTLSFSTSDIEAMQLNENGELTFTFRDGDSFTIGNFRSLAENRIELSMEDGEIINSQELFERLAGEPPAALIPQPSPGESIAYELKADEKYEFGFNQTAVENVETQDGVLLITFADNGTLVLKNFEEAMDSGATAADESAEDGYVSLREFVDALQLASAMNDNMQDGETDGEGEQTAQTEIRSQEQNDQQMAELAQELAEIEPAAGEAGGAGRGGFGFGSTFTATPLNTPDDVGPIGPTQLVFTLP